MSTKVKSFIAVGSLALAASAAAAPSGSSMPEQIDTAELIDLMQQISQSARPRSAPQNFGVSSGFGMPRGSFAVAGTITDQGSPQNKDPDGSIGLGVGLGDPVNAIGLDVYASIVSTDLSDFAEDGSLAIKLHRNLPGFVPGGVSAVSVGVTQAATWGAADLLDENYYGAFSTYLPMPTGVSSLITVGYGSNVDAEARLAGVSFGAEEDFFASLGIGWNQYIDTSVSWNGTETLAAVGFRPFPAENVTLTAGIGDLSDRNNNRRALVTLSWFKPNLF